ncbi:Nuclease domain-containign protein, RpnA-like [Desulfonema limicola]|uniref:Nuclease domain-containign protein, RpnA-like n=1 Tax=Desulfonema limicola TaxID=45656 RepID=A0A975BBY5_9BACT|nr:Rpn family recombination-promoting nuclease/putative transposase [Desulfonema limicola]QTA82819.1 Nuclease domain-containign protein, RpnA-like [Desulfonema limicola]
MKDKIDPLIDCVFKSILGSEKNKNLLIHFLNAVLELKKGERIYDAAILNPYNEREFTGDKLSVVDVKAKDEKGSMYQIEVQLAIHADIKARMLYTWSTVYRSQMEKGEDYEKLKPAISIWILDKNLFQDVDSCHLPFSVYNPENKIILTDHLSIHVIQVPKWKHKDKIDNEKDRWIYLFKEGRNTDPENPPEILNTKEMRQVMQVLKDFSENQRNYLLYQSRREAIIKENTIIKRYEEKAEELKKALKEKKKAFKDREDAFKEKEKAFKEKENALKEKKKADEKIKSLMMLLKEKGIEIPDER